MFKPLALLFQVSQAYNGQMFIRKRKNKSGTTSVHIISKTSGNYRVVKAVGFSRDPNEIERLVRKARDDLYQPSDHQPPLFATQLPGDSAVENFLDSVASAHIHTIGPELIFGSLFDRIGFNVIPNKLFRHITIARLAYPASKLKTVDYLFRYQGIKTTEDAIYKFLDSVYNTHKAIVERVAFEHTKKTLGTIFVIFYDMTTLYFEAEDEDDLRKMGWSKDGKNECPQIMLGLLVGEGGLPIGYDIFEGNTFEGQTLLQVLKETSRKYKLGKPVVVADAAMLSHKNIEELQTSGYTFVVGGRIKNESEAVKAEILKNAKGALDGLSFEVARMDGTRLIVTYSEKRARKDARNRDKGLKKLRARVAAGKLTKAQITNRGYNKFLTLSGKVTIAIDEDKIKSDVAWDGLKGYVTNTTLPRGKIVEHYGHLWQIEKAFRISKTDLRVRPMFHYKRRRIEAHLCVTFVAYAIWKELERLLQKSGVKMSPRRAGDLTHTIYELEYTLPQSKKTKRKILAMSEEQRLLYEVIHRK